MNNKIRVKYAYRDTALVCSRMAQADEQWSMLRGVLRELAAVGRSLWGEEEWARFERATYQPEPRR